VSGVGTTIRNTARALCGVIAILLALLMTAHSSPAAQSDCASPGKVYAQKILVEYEEDEKDERLDWITVFLVCQPNGHVKIVDHEGQAYDDLADFRANNNLLSERDKILVPRNFPSTERSGDVDLMTVSGHTSPSRSWLWWLVGGTALVLIAGGGGFLRLRARRRSARAPASDAAPVPDAEPQEP
jgi:hypothetical protein